MHRTIRAALIHSRFHRAVIDHRFCGFNASIKKICDGLQITVREFFDSPFFDETEQEIK